VVNEAVRRSGTKGFPKTPCKEFKIYITAQTDDDFPFVLKYAGKTTSSSARIMAIPTLPAKSTP
jgi:hypothetical protein